MIFFFLIRAASVQPCNFALSTAMHVALRCYLAIFSLEVAACVRYYLASLSPFCDSLDSPHSQAWLPPGTPANYLHDAQHRAEDPCEAEGTL
jgi:hypothetical protein